MPPEGSIGRLSAVVTGWQVVDALTKSRPERTQLRVMADTTLTELTPQHSVPGARVGARAQCASLR